MQGTNTKKM